MLGNDFGKVDNMKRFMLKDFLVTVPDGWEENADVPAGEGELWIKRDAGNTDNFISQTYSMVIIASKPTDNNLNLDFYVKDHSADCWGETEVLLKELVEINGVKVYREDSITKEYSDYTERVYMIFIKDNFKFSLLCSHYIDSPQDCSLINIEDEIISIVSKIKTRNLEL